MPTTKIALDSDALGDLKRRDDTSLDLFVAVARALADWPVFSPSRRVDGHDPHPTERFTADCAVACLAMFLGVEYEDVLRHVGGHELTLRGLTNYREAYIARLFEVEISFLDRTKIDRSKPAVLTVPSLNSKTGLTHAVYWDGTRIYDPNQGCKGKKTYTSQAAWEVAIDGYQRLTRRAM